jgi:hypothetical protein
MLHFDAQFACYPHYAMTSQASLNSTAPLAFGDGRRVESDVDSSDNHNSNRKSRYQRWQKKTARILESDRLHNILIFLVCVILHLSWLKRSLTIANFTTRSW